MDGCMVLGARERGMMDFVGIVHREAENDARALVVGGLYESKKRLRGTKVSRHTLRER